MTGASFVPFGFIQFGSTYPRGGPFDAIYDVQEWVIILSEIDR